MAESLGGSPRPASDNDEPIAPLTWSIVGECGFVLALVIAVIGLGVVVAKANVSTPAKVMSVAVVVALGSVFAWMIYRWFERTFVLRSKKK